MMNIIVDNVATIVSSILITIITTIIIFYLKDKKTKSLEVLEYSNHPIRMLNSLIMATNISNIIAIWLSFRLYLYGSMEFNSYLLAFLFNQITISLLIITIINFHKEYLDNELKTKKERILFLVVMIVLWILLFRCQYLIFTFVPRIAENKIIETIKTIEFIVWFYTILFLAWKYLKLYVTKNYKKILVRTKDSGIYQALEINYHDEFITLYDMKNGSKVLIFNDQINSIEYEYQEKTIKELT